MYQRKLLTFNNYLLEKAGGKTLQLKSALKQVRTKVCVGQSAPSDCKDELGTDQISAGLLQPYSELYGSFLRHVMTLRNPAAGRR